ncbi:MAG: hypothetical protein ACLGHB_07750 [Gammaproteobacteria bacterium]
MKPLRWMPTPSSIASIARSCPNAPEIGSTCAVVSKSNWLASQ